ncbi:MAG: hypothetical protein R3F45_03775 [Gammaproteobacteria bacterium]
MKVPSPHGDIHYRLNDRDEIVFVNQAWDAFASANSGEHLTAPHVLGLPLWEFIVDRTTRALYKEILARVRGGRSVRFLLRCDSPEYRRLLEMEVSRGLDDVTDFRIRTLSQQARERQPLLDTDRPHSEEFLRVCGWCKKVHAGGRWVEVEEAVSLLGLFVRPLLPAVTHGICEDCYSRMVATISEGDKGAEPDAEGDGGGVPAFRGL